VNKIKSFLGVGLGNAIGLALFVGVVHLMLKVIVNKHPVNGMTEVVNAM
jgi:hypothetical protein